MVLDLPGGGGPAPSRDRPRGTNRTPGGNGDPGPVSALRQTPRTWRHDLSTWVPTCSFPLEPGNEQFVFTHEGDRMFVVVVRSDALVEERGVTMEVVLVDMRGPFETVVELLVKRPGTGYFEVITDGQWYIDLPG